MEKIYKVLPEFVEKTHLSESEYYTLYQQSITDPEGFWAQQAKKFITWFAPWQNIKKGDFAQQEITWFAGGKLNACVNCLDRHLPERAQQIAIIWEGDDPQQQVKITYAQLFEKVCAFANALIEQGFKKGDPICIYMPMIPETLIAMLACARIGAIHSVVFGGFSAESLQSRINDAACKLVITADAGVRGGRQIPLKENVDKAVAKCSCVEKVIVVKHLADIQISWDGQRDLWFHEIIAHQKLTCEPAVMDAEDPLFILYTSGSTGTPKGIVHSTGGYLVYVAMTFYYVFDYHENDIFWCTADVGWITGHSYLLYGPLLNGATTVMFEGVPHYPSFSRCWEIIDKHKINIFYTAPTALRALRHEGDDWVTKTSRRSLKLLGTVGEPINPEVWQWYYDVVGEGRCPIVDTWWQTETGGIMISPLPGAISLKPGAASKPFFGVVPQIVDEEHNVLGPGESGKLVIAEPWPGMMQTVYGNKKRFIETYFSEVPGKYLTGDNASYDADGYFWIKGRNDDVIKISGHRIGTEEVESALVSHQDVSEAAVVGVSHEIKGETIYAFVSLKANVSGSESLKKELNQIVRDKVGAIAIINTIQWTAELPKTRSGKIMRRILRKIANNEFDALGDTSTLADPRVVDELIKEKKSHN